MTLALSPSPPSLPEVPETIELEVRSSTPTGLLLWQGVVSVGTGREQKQPLQGTLSTLGPYICCAFLAGGG